MTKTPTMNRRVVLVAAAGLPFAPAAMATPETQQAVMFIFSGGRTPRTGRITLDIASLIDNGNVVPVTISVESPMSEADHVQRIGLFTAQNPLPQAAVFHLGPRNGIAKVATRMRVATTQTITAMAVMNDGSVWQQQVDVIVTLAACIE